MNYSLSSYVKVSNYSDEKDISQNNINICFENCNNDSNCFGFVTDTIFSQENTCNKIFDTENLKVEQDGDSFLFLKPKMACCVDEKNSSVPPLPSSVPPPLPSSPLPSPPSSALPPSVSPPSPSLPSSVPPSIYPPSSPSTASPSSSKENTSTQDFFPLMVIFGLFACIILIYYFARNARTVKSIP